MHQRKVNVFGKRPKAVVRGGLPRASALHDARDQRIATFPRRQLLIRIEIVF